MVEFAGNDRTTIDWLSLYIDGTSNVKANGAGIILTHSPCPTNLKHIESQFTRFHSIKDGKERVYTYILIKE